MIDLHLHLDGSLDVKTVLSLAAEENITLPANTEAELRDYLTAPKNCKDLNEYLTRFEVPLQVLQTKAALSFAVYDLVKRLDNMGLWYVEIRFAPQLHTARGLTQTEAVRAAIDGLQKAIGECEMKAQLILCCMRGDKNEAANIETVHCARAFLHGGVAALDLAGAEGLYRTSMFENVFCLAKKLQIPFTIHAGEADGPESIADAVRFGAARIGHGLRAREDDALVGLLAEWKIPLELCPTSNLQTKAVPNIHDYPLCDYLKRGIVATVNTDNMTVSNTTLQAEYTLLREGLNLTVEEEKQLLQNAIFASFADEDEKEKFYRLMAQK